MNRASNLLYGVLCCLLALGAAPAARAHAQSTSSMVIDLGADPVTLRWELALHDLIWSVFIDSDFDGLASGDEIETARPAIEKAVLQQLTLTRGDVACALSIVDLTRATRDGQEFLTVAMLAQCPNPGALSIGGALFMTGDATQRVRLSAHRGGEMMTGTLSAVVPRWEEPREISAWDSFVQFVVEGVWHVLIGYDHIAFVLLLLLPSVMRPVDGRWQGAAGFAPVTRDIVTIVTAFTLAHSTTLALAVTGMVVLPTQPIEVAIAASIAVAGSLNLLPQLSGWRLPLAFGFGLVHGFGFANALREIEAVGSGLLPLLAGFNVGVELAQLGIVALVLPVIYSIRARRWYGGGVLPLGSCALGAAGLVWLVQRW